MVVLEAPLTPPVRVRSGWRDLTSGPHRGHETARQGEGAGIDRKHTHEGGGEGGNIVDIEAPHEQLELRRGLLRALRNTGIIVIYQAVDLTVLWAQNVPRAWSSEAIDGVADESFMPAEVRAHIGDLKRSVVTSGLQQKLEFRDGSHDGGRWFEMWIDADRDEDRSITGLVTTIVDITEQKHREQTLRTLLREVSHRSKNLLAIILSIATQTGRYSGTIDAFLNRFRGRIQSLASSQDLVTSSNWRGAMLRKLIEEQVVRYCGDTSYSVRFAGVDPYLNPNAALHIGLAIHELVVNSVSHGALAQPGGSVEITAALEDEGDNLMLVWSEPTDMKALPDERRFGSVALERVVPASLDGDAVLSIDERVLRYRLRVPHANFELL